MTPDNRNLYSISDLADQVGVPRTTITDWLGKYARFVELKTQGRRRFYTERTLSVLCRIAELRAAGRSSGDIDGELERIFPVHPTVEPPDTPSGTFAQDTAGTAPAASADAPNPGETYPVVKQENFDELYDLLGTRFSDLCEAMSAVNRKADASARRLRLMSAVAIMIIVVLAGLLAVFFAYFRIQRDNTARLSALARDSEKRELELRTDLAAVSGKADDIQNLRDELTAQREAFEASLEEMTKSSGAALDAQKAQFEAQLARQKDQYAAETLKLLGERDAASNRAEDLQKKNETLAGELTAAEKRAADEAEARKKAEADADRLRTDLNAASGAADDLRNLRADLAAASGAADDLQKKNDALADELSSAEKRAADEAEARKKAEADADRLRADLAAASGKAEDLQKKNETLAGELSSAEKRAADEAEARKKAEAEVETVRRAADAARNTQEPSPDAASSRNGQDPAPDAAGQSAAQ